MRRVSNIRSKRRKGNILVLSAILLVPLCAILAFSVDLAVVHVENTRLQNGADAAAFAAALNIDSSPDAIAAAIAFAEQNCPNSGTVLQGEDVEFGTWDPQSRSFTAGSQSPNAVRVTLRRDSSSGNAVELYFARVLGRERQNLEAQAIAFCPNDGTAFQLLVDDEMIDSDEEDIEDLANSMGVDPDDLIYDNDDDGFIDLPPGTTLELPTGQVGDEALFDISSYGNAFPFQASSTYTTTDFLAEGTAFENDPGIQNLQDVEWSGSDPPPHSELNGKKLLDPTTGVDPVDSHSDVAALADGSTTHVSPVFESDVSMAETDPSKYGSPAANLQGARRGLLAFKIMSSRPNPAGGSYLPLLTIRVENPVDISTVTIGQSGGGGGGGSKISLVK